MGTSWIDNLEARRQAAAEPLPAPRAMPGAIVPRSAPAPAVDMESLRQEVSGWVRDEVSAAMGRIETVLQSFVHTAQPPAPAVTTTPTPAPQSPPEAPISPLASVTQPTPVPAPQPPETTVTDPASPPAS